MSGVSGLLRIRGEGFGMVMCMYGVAAYERVESMRYFHVCIGLFRFVVLLTGRVRVRAF